MFQKHLFRVKPRGRISARDAKEIEPLLDELERLDDCVSAHFPLNLLEVPADKWFDREWGSNTVYSRDYMVHHRTVIYANPQFIDYPEFERVLRTAGYSGSIEYLPNLSEGGCWIYGDRFVLISDEVRKPKGLVQIIFRGIISEIVADITDNWNAHFLEPTSSNGHIDCDYGVVDDLGILYFRPNTQTKSLDNYSLLQKITLESRYQLRPYPMPTQDAGSRNSNGINFISGNGKLLTTYIDPDERKYLERRGINVIELPSYQIDSDLEAGLRCIYGEFYVSNGVAGI